MIKDNIGLCFLSQKDYRDIAPPFHPKEQYAELGFLPAGSDFINTHNEIYEGVRQLFALLKLNAENFGHPTWNPLCLLLKPGNTVVIKPNLVRHFNENPNGTLDSVITHGSILRPIVDYCLKALDFEGRIIIADAPQHDCDIEQVKKFLGVEVLKEFYREHFNFELEFLDLRQEFVRFTNGIITERTKLPGDPLGYSVVDLREDSAFGDMKASCDLLRGADYDEEETIAHHNNGKHEYLISKTVLNANLVINVPKIKTHKKAGVTLALKNMVGINGNKNWLPHHRAGFPKKRRGSFNEAGDEFPTRKVRNVIRGFVAEKARYFLKQGKFQRLFRFVRQMENVVGGAPAIRSGNWYGNDTIWRTVVDLNKILFFSAKIKFSHSDGKLRGELFDDRKYMVIFDGVVAGEGNGPMAPQDKPLGVICGGFDPILIDILLVKLMGFDWRKIPKIYHSTQLDKYRYTVFTESDDVEVEIFHQSSGESERLRLSEVGINWGFKPHVGWEGHI
jgi:uncharacterized protein (DUF362 family)